nr:DNA cytosine methyltransferase [uncultured Agathobaculum sp.]
MKQNNRAKAQVDLFDEIIVDNFAGGGGASTGIELAAGRPVTIAINHDPDAILLHKTNHPYTEHYQEDVWSVDPRAVCGGRKVGLAWFSPDCKHFSKAKGAALVDRKIRGLAWIVLKWAALVRPRVIMLENVEEFQTWGPVRKGKPVKKKAGQTFQKWKSQLAALGYQIDHRELVMADYGAPTTRKRFCLIARCDGKPIVWPERTHAPRDSEEVRRGVLKPWRSAAEVIDWSIPAYSIFDSKQEIKRKYGVNAVRPLADNTMRRVIRGVDKFTIRSGRPFLVPVGYGERKGQAPRVHDLDDPLPTVVSTAKQSLCAPVLCQVNHACGDRSQNVQDTMPTITAKHGYGVSESVLAPITLTNTGASVGGSAGEPVHTVRTGGGGQILAAANLIQYHTEQNENVRANGLHEPLPTADASNRYALTTAQLVEYYGAGRSIDVEEPMHTVTSHDREAVVMAHIVKFKGNDLGQHPEQPLQTVTASAGEFAACHVYLAKATGGDFGYWPLVRDLLNKYCGYTLAENEILLLRIGGKLYFIADILLRMLQPRELYNAMGFPPDYVIDRDYLGNEYKKTKQVARCGNAVCPPLATALVRANLPEWCGGEIGTMAELGKVVAV